MVFNEYDEKRKFYKMANTELKLRRIANNFPNAYIVSIFATCRQDYN